MEVLDDFLVGTNLVNSSDLEALRALLAVLYGLHLVINTLFAVGMATPHKNQGNALRIKTLVTPVAKREGLRLLHY